MWTIKELEGNIVSFEIGDPFPRVIQLKKEDFQLDISGDEVIIFNSSGPYDFFNVRFRLRTFVVAAVVDKDGGEIDEFLSAQDLYDALEAIWVVYPDESETIRRVVDVIDGEDVVLDCENATEIYFNWECNEPLVAADVQNVVPGSVFDITMRKIYALQTDVTLSGDGLLFVLEGSDTPASALLVEIASPAGSYLTVSCKVTGLDVSGDLVVTVSKLF
jgi:hypothetical protein